MKKIILLCFLAISCEDVKRVWDNPYDPRSDRSLWMPDSLKIEQISLDKIELSWLRKGRDFDGFKIEKKIGEGNWVDSVAVLWDSIYSWIDTLDLKEVVTNPVEYSYRLYAYADSNISNKVGISIKPNVPGPPQPVDVIAVDYVPNETIPAENKKHTVKWEKSLEGSFKKYHLNHTVENSSDTSIITFDDVNTTSWDTNKFDAKKQHWYWVEMEDSTGQKTKGSAKANLINKVPPAVQLDSIIYKSGFFELKWSSVNIEDFDKYIIQKIDIITGDTINIIKTVRETAFDDRPAERDEEHQYQIITIDEWADSSFSNIRNSSSYRRIVKVDNLVETGDDITIANLGPNLSFKHVFSQVNAYFPIWIQGGNKVFSFYDGGVGLVVNEDGSNFKKITGIEALDIAFDLTGLSAVFTGEDHNIYYLSINSNDAPNLIATHTNNEWYSDPEIFLENDKQYILYSKRKYHSNNNVGVEDIYTSDVDNNSIIKLTNAQNQEKFIMPRMSPDQSKILYVKEKDGLYIMDYPGIENIKPVTENGEKLVPVYSKYFRNIRWSPDSKRAIFWTYKNSTYFLYVFELGGDPEIKLLEVGGRYADWIEDSNTILFRSEPSNAMFKKDVSSLTNTDPTPFSDAPWAQLQPWK